MPILTTTYPLMNSTFNVSQHTLKLIQEKMLVAAGVCDRILEGAQHQWEILFKVIPNFWFGVWRPLFTYGSGKATPNIDFLCSVTVIHDESFCDDCSYQMLGRKAKEIICASRLLPCMWP